MSLTGIHLLLTYECNSECDHCFVWGSPKNRGTMTLGTIQKYYAGAQDLGTVKSVYFEGGEPFLYYPIMVRAIEEAEALGMEAGIVTNGYWITEVEDAVEWLRPLGALKGGLSVSSDLFHGEEEAERVKVGAILEAAQMVGLPTDFIAIEEPRVEEADPEAKGEPIVAGSVRFRGRAVATLSEGLPRRPWPEFTECPHETLDDPKRVHIDYLGYLHACQGLTIGNALETPLSQAMREYHPASHPIIGPLLEGGPAALVKRYDLPVEEGYVEACHLCYAARQMLRPRFPEYLGPGQMYGEGLK